MAYYPYIKRILTAVTSSRISVITMVTASFTSQIDTECVLGAEQRTYCHRVKKNTDTPRSTFPVEFYDKPENAH